MSDQCKHCQLRGDINKCLAADCSKHEDWFAVQILTENANLKASNKVLVDALEEIIRMSDYHARNIITSDKRERQT